ncbi:hypothetical protein ACN38_g11910 [Penicillium nordicum]|uniref:Uncharacterized protein n=1 Tax=Penicillium nordicum TaxID=229535 RepID=A0A0M8NZ31_9EURO|nr:hypothetical protein ACN38_g11910 [Penicillium nordicum]
MSELPQKLCWIERADGRIRTSNRRKRSTHDDRLAIRVKKQVYFRLAHPTFALGFLSRPSLCLASLRLDLTPVFL